MIFQDWTAKIVEARLLEAMQTHLLLPKVHGPREFGNAMPEIVREKWKDAAPSKTQYRKRLEPDAITRMEECWAWTSAMIDGGDRIFIDEWARLKISKGRRLKEISGNDTAVAKSINRRKHRVCSMIANELNRKWAVRLNSGDCSLSEIGAPIASSTVTSDKRDHGATHWIAEDAKPHLDPALPKSRVIKPRKSRARRNSKPEAMKRQTA